MPDRRPVSERKTMRRTQRRPLGGVMSRARWLVLVAALLSFSWQSLVAETHFHSEGPTSAAIFKHGKQGLPAQHRAPSDSPANCPICRELAHAHNYLAPAPITFEAPETVLRPLLFASRATAAFPQRWYGWRSRAPPLLHQA